MHMQRKDSPQLSAVASKGLAVLRAAILSLCAAAVSLGAGAALAQAYPSKPVKLVVPFPPGAYTDSVARLVAQKLSEKWGQPVTVENRPGAAGNIGTDHVAKSEPNGYTLIMATVANTISVSLYKNLTHDFVKDLSPVSLVATVPLVLVANPSIAARSVQELVQITRASPGKFSYASGGNGSTGHLAGEMFNSMTRGQIVHVPYKGITPAVTDLVGGQVSLMFASMDSALPLIKAGRVKALAVTSAKRSPMLPDSPSMVESGFAGFESAAWAGILAPAGTPKAVVDALNAEVSNILRMPDVRERLTSLGAEPGGGSPEDFAAFIAAEIAKWARVVKASGARVD
jgi:tripartite-type tricarboxylate transporter receptor subunit TctC